MNLNEHNNKCSLLVSISSLCCVPGILVTALIAEVGYLTTMTERRVGSFHLQFKGIEVVIGREGLAAGI